jgi:tetratricopeptide (TPR) repeat protein
MFDAIRNWFEVRAAVKDARRIRSGQATLNSIIVSDKLKHAGEMIHAGQMAYATAIIDEMLERYPSETADLPVAIGILIDLRRLDEAEALTLRAMRANPDSREFAHLHCEIAERRGDIGERLRRWRAFRRRYPVLAMAFGREARALVAAGQDAAAEELLREGVRTVPDDLGLAIEYAQRADAREDWPEAYRRWLVVRDAHAAAVGAVASATALARQGLDEQAEAELLAARARFPLEPRIVEDLAALAERRGNLDGALAYLAELRRDLPHITRGYTEAARLLRERGDQPAADALIAEGAARAPNDRGLQVDHAALADRDGDWAEAARRWQRTRQRFDFDPLPYAREATALRALGRLDEAEEVLLAAHTRFPDAADIRQHLAELAEARGDLTLAADRWRAVVAAAPDVWWMRSALARVLARGGDRAGADDALAAAIARLPDEPSLYAEHAALAAQDGRADDAAARWAAARQRFGLHPTIARGEANWLRGQDRLAEARAVLGAASQLAPDNADVLHDLGHLAAQERDWAEAERCWRAVLALHPQAGWPYGELARALREQGRAAEAEGMLAEAWERHPRDFGIGSAWARAASEARDWPEARRRWALLGERFPAEGHPVWQEGIALRETGEPEQAGALFIAGAERFPADASFPHDLARLAEARQDDAQAEHWWRRYQALQPDAWWGWLGLATAVHAQGRVEEAEELLLRGGEACPTVHAFLHMHAEWARHRRDWPEAERRAVLLAERFPDAWEGLWGQAIAVREQGRPDEARTLLLSGADRHPNVNVFAHDLARLAESRAEWAEAERWWRAFLALDDTAPWAHGVLADAVSRQDRAEEADRHLLDAIARHPDDIAFHQQYALAADRRGDPDLSRQRWRPVVERFPDDATSLRHLADALVATGDMDEATRLLISGLERFPHDRSITRALMTIAADRRDEAAAAKWRARLLEMLREALEQQPDDPGLLVEFVHAMAALPQSEWPIPALQIERSLQAAIDRGNSDGLLHAAYAGIAAGRADWPEQYRRLQASVERFPNDAFLRTKLFAAREIMLAAAEHGPSEENRPTAPDGARPDLPASELVLYFESLGGGGANEEGWGFGCEFGYFQREYGQEPLSLLRWASIGPDHLIRALNEDFAGFGNPDAIGLADDSGDDWAVDDTVYHSRFDHTHLSRANVPRDEAKRLVAMRMKFLARKLVGDLQAGEKIFVYRVIDRELTQTTILRLAQAVNRFGRNIMLFVALADDDHPAFQVRHVHPGLMIGYIDFFRARGGRFREWNHDGWLRLCREAVRAWQANAPETPDVPAISDFQDGTNGQHKPLRSSLADGMNQALLEPAGAPTGASDASPIPQDFATACAWARQAVEAKDWSEAQHRWAQLRERFPAEGHPCWQQAIALREAGQTQEAHAVLLAGAAQFPHDPSFPHDLARLAEGRDDWPAAERGWRAFLRLQPDLWWAHTALAHALTQQDRLDEAETVLVAAHAALPNDNPILVDYARLAQRRRDWAEAERRFRDLADRFPDLGDGLLGLATAAREQGRIEEAEQNLRQGVERYPHMADFAHDLARLAEGRRDWAAAERHWRAFLALAPHLWWAHTSLANALREQGRPADAEAVLEAAITALPDEVSLLADYAQLATRAGGWPAALARWTQLRERFPDDPRGYVEAAFALRELGRAEEADALLGAAADRLPHETRVPREIACVAEHRGDWAAAEQWWRRLHALDPTAWEARVGIATALCAQGDVTPAMAMLAELAGQPGADTLCLARVATVAFAHAPSIADPWLHRLEDDLAAAVAGQPSPPVWLAYAGIAKRQERFEVCRDRLEIAAAQWPDDLAIRFALADARDLAPRAEDAVQPPPAPNAPGTDALLLGLFDSLGGNEGGCEFGFYQRDHGFEPLSLLRWASIEPGQLCDLLERGFEGLGRTETVSLRAQGHYDWQAVELTYGIRMDHTHLDRKTVSIETASRLVCNMLRFLSRKLADDLRLGEKVFVYRMSDAIVPPDVAARLQDAVASYGDGRLLLVGEGSPATPPIELQRLSPRCLQVIRAPIGNGATREVRIASWQAICRAAAAEFALTPPAEATGD